jgi:rhodanese-related sulfurtransferase
MPTTIDREQLAAALRVGGVTVVETLPAEYYARGHLPGAVLIPDGQAAELAPLLLPDRRTTIVTYCSGTGCANSKNVAGVLEDLGYTHVQVYEAGKQDWIEAGLPVHTGQAV